MSTKKTFTITIIDDYTGRGARAGGRHMGVHMCAECNDEITKPKQPADDTLPGEL